MPRRPRAPEGLAQQAIKAGLPLIAAIYDRVSNDTDDTAKSVGEQENENQEACADNGWEVFRSYVDNDLSASRFTAKGREDWLILLEDLAAGRFHVLVLWEASRGDRDLERWVTLVNQCRRIGILIHISSHERTYDPRKAADWKSLMQEGLDAAMESERTSERVSRHRRSAAKSGKPKGRIPYGYRREYGIDDRGRRYLVGQFIDEEPRTATAPDGTVTVYTRAGVVRDAAAWVAAGKACRWVAVRLNERGVPTPANGKRGWSQPQVTALVTNPAYVARCVHRGVVQEGVAGEWPPILQPETYEACVAACSDPAKVWSKPGSVRHLGSGLYLCGVCGSPVRVGYSSGEAMYVCWPVPYPGKGTQAFCVGRKKGPVDLFVQRAVWLRLAKPDIAELLAEDSRADEAASRLRAAIVEKEGRLAEARDAFAEGRLPLEGLQRIEAKLGGEVREARAAMSRARVGPVLDGLVLPSLADVEAEWGRRTLDQRREVMRVLTEKIEILPVGRGRRTYDPEESVRITWRKPGR